MSISKDIKKIVASIWGWIDVLIYMVGVVTIFLYVTERFPKLYSIVSTVVLIIFAGYYTKKNVINPFIQGLNESRSNKQIHPPS